MIPSLEFYWVNGQPSSGKDTHADPLMRRFPQQRVVKISTGDIFRSAKETEGEFARFHDRIVADIENVQAGGLVRDETIIDILKEVVAGHILEGVQYFFFTGVPRTRRQLKMIDKWIKDLDRSGFEVNSSFLSLHVSRETLRERMEQRVQEASMRGEVPRSDDNWPSMIRRLSTYKRLTEPMLSRLASEGRLTIFRNEGEKETNRLRFEEAFDPRLLNPENYPPQPERR